MNDVPEFGTFQCSGPAVAVDATEPDGYILDYAPYGRYLRDIGILPHTGDISIRTPD